MRPGSRRLVANGFRLSSGASEPRRCRPAGLAVGTQRAVLVLLRDAFAFDSERLPFVEDNGGFRPPLPPQAVIFPRVVFGGRGGGGRLSFEVSGGTSPHAALRLHRVLSWQGALASIRCQVQEHPGADRWTGFFDALGQKAVIHVARPPPELPPAPGALRQIITAFRADRRCVLLVSKTGLPLRVTWVRIPPSPLIRQTRF